MVRFRALHGDPTDPDTMADIKETFSSGNAGITTGGLTATPADVHGYPAARIQVTANYGGLLFTVISTVIQTGDHVYEVTVTSPSAERAAALSDQIVPTFAPV